MSGLRQSLCLLLLSLAAVAAAQTPGLEGDQIYRVATVRAAPGAFSDLIDWARSGNGDEFYVARHSQGDHWDLMFIIPLAEVSIENPLAVVEPLIAFQEDMFAYGPEVDALAEAYADNRLIHIEVFAALPGKKAALLEQRRMENNYLASTGQVENMIFDSVAGSDIDVFTIGFHKDLAAFAASGPDSEEAGEKAAKAAGFKNRADLSFYLRSLIASHHDTLAGPVD
ncbi:MAG: hypothetical protein QNJ19_18050 [Woeseiaceae bacterium]|nr:hypothetical protein [Woeseiaceae bacterium]